jgi:hypothetical protein
MQDGKDNVEKMVFVDKEGKALYEQELYSSDPAFGIMVLLTESEDIKNPDADSHAAILGGMSEYDTMVMLNNLINEMADRKGMSSIHVATTAALGTYEGGHDCETCEHPCNKNDNAHAFDDIFPLNFDETNDGDDYDEDEDDDFSDFHNQID